MGIELSKEKVAQINLRKDKVIDLTKKLGIFGEKAQVFLVMDKFRDGLVQRILERIVPLALQFDDNATLDVVVFHNDAFEAVPCTLANLEGYVQKEILAKFNFGGTSYAPAIKLVRGGIANKVKGALKKLGGMFASLMGNKSEDTKQLPTYVIFVTDGDSGDHRETEQQIRDASNEPIFWQFVGIGGERFPFLEKLDDLTGREIDNASFFAVRNIDKMSDDDLYSKLLEEFPGWYKEMRQRGKIA